MAFWSLLMFKARDGLKDRSAQGFIKRRAIEESAETIPGFLHGEIVVSTDEPDQLCVLCSRADKALLPSLVGKFATREAGADPQDLGDGEARAMMFRSVHTVSKPPSSSH